MRLVFPKDGSRPQNASEVRLVNEKNGHTLETWTATSNGDWPATHHAQQAIIDMLQEAPWWFSNHILDQLRPRD